MTPIGIKQRISLEDLSEEDKSLTTLKTTSSLTVLIQIYHFAIISLISPFWIAYILIQQDVANMAKAYVHDICGYIDVANKENVRILSKSDLIWLTCGDKCAF